MSFIVATMKKMKMENLGGIQRHNQREFKHHSNQEIDSERTDLNYDLVNKNPIDYQKNVMGYIEKHRKSSRAVRKDAVVVDEWIISSDNAFFENVGGPRRVQSYFETAKQFFEENYGKNNIRYANVHLDETTPHMHMGIVPMTEDGRLSSKNVFTRQELKKIQDDLPKYMQDHGFEVERGHEDGERKKLTVKEYKDMQKEKSDLDSVIRNTAIDTITEFRPDVEVTQQMFDDRKKKAKDTSDFYQKYGFDPQPIATPQGRRQVSDWFSLSFLVKQAKRFMREFHQRIMQEKEEIERRTQNLKKLQEKEIPTVQSRIDEAQKELNQYREHQMWNRSRGPRL